MAHVGPIAGRLSVLVAVLGLPLLGAWLAARPLAEYFRFPPPLAIAAGYVRFSWAAAGAVLAVLLATILPWTLSTRRRAADAAAGAAAPQRGRWPGWGTAAAGWTLAWWGLAWTRWPAFEAGQRYTFFPLWLGFIVTVNALTQARAGTCLMRRAPGRWLGLFGASAACWWGFEWLNRFVRNWHYLNVEDFGPVAYAAHATVCFATVLPAVAAVAEHLQTYPAWRARTGAGPRWPWLGRAWARPLLAGGGALAMIGAGALPGWCYPALWVGPLAIFLALPPRAGGSRLALEIAAGDWRQAATWMAAATICGFCWEMWNWHSLAKWIYTVPGVERWYVFEMPILGYAGYLPFGLECYAVAERWLAGGPPGQEPRPGSQADARGQSKIGKKV